MEEILDCWNWRVEIVSRFNQVLILAFVRLWLQKFIPEATLMARGRSRFRDNYYLLDCFYN